MKIINIFLANALFTVVAVPVAFGCNCQQKASIEALPKKDVNPQAVMESFDQDGVINLNR